MTPNTKTAEEILKAIITEIDDCKKNEWIGDQVALAWDRALDKAISIVEEYATLKSGEQWVSVSERLPEEYGEQYIVCLLFMDGSHECITAVFESDNRWYNLEDKDFVFMNVIKWQPLPKP